MFKRILKIFLWTAIVFLVLFLIALLIIRINFPPQKIKQLAISELEAAINRKAQVGETWFNPVKGFSLNNVVIYQQAPGDSNIVDTTSFFRSKKIHLKYRFLSLLKREIEINNILIDQPEINLRQDQNQQWNFEDLIVVDSTVVPPPPDTGAAEFSLPLSIKLKKFSLDNFTMNLIIDRADTVYTIRSGGLSIHVDDLFLPRQPFEEFKKNVRADLKLFSNENPWELALHTKSSSEKTELKSNLHLDLKINLSGLNSVQSEGKLAVINFQYEKKDKAAIGNKISLPKLASLYFSLSTDTEKGNMSITELTGQIGNETLFNIQGKITDYLNQPVFDLAVVNSDIKLQNFINLMLPFLPDSIQQQRKDISITGLASFNGTTVKGNPLSENITDALTVNLLFSVDKFFGSYVDPRLKLNNLNIKSQFTEVHNLNGVQGTDISINASLDSFYLAVDTLEFGYGGLTLDLKTALDAEFMPDSFTTNFSVQNFYQVPLNFSLFFKAINGLNKFRANGSLVVNQLPLWNLPEVPLAGLVDFALNLEAETLDQIELDLKAESDIIEVQTETEPLILYPMDFLGEARLATDTAFQAIKLNQFKMAINNFASALMHGDFQLGSPQQVNLWVDHLIVDHQEVMEILPPQLLEGIESLSVTGRSKLTSAISIVIPDDQEPIIDVRGKVAVNAGVEYPEAFFLLKHVDGIVNFSSDGESGIFDLEAVLDSLIIEGVQDEPLKDMSLVVNGSFPDLETIKFDSSKLIIPELMTQVFVKGQIDSLSSNMFARFDGDLSFDSKTDTVSLLNFLKLSGKLAQRAELSLVDNIAEIRGLLKVDHLTLKYEEMAQADSIMAEIYFTQKYDVEQGTLIEQPANRSFFTQAGSYYYDLLRPYYQQSHGQFSWLRIGKVQAMNYYASDINFDIFILNERIEIPRFTLNAYDGNMSGLLYANLHQGKLDQIEWKVKANLSQLNSAKLLSSRRFKARGSDLNMNLELVGSGIDPATKLEVEGYLYVTQIGPQFTDNVLRSLDPRRTDKSIQDTRKLLNWGYKPKLLSFEVKHGNLYPVIHLVKGKLLTKLIPLNLSGGKIELARIPVKFFMKNMMTESQ